MLRWELTDGTTTTTLSFNPREMGNVWWSRSLNAFTTTGGAVLLTEGAATPATMEFSGVVYTKSQYDALIKWFVGPQRNQRITITDHYGRELTCVTQRIELRPRHDLTRYWVHEYNASVLVTSVGTATIGDDGNELP